jgi:hypothetical protein
MSYFSRQFRISSTLCYPCRIELPILTSVLQLPLMSPLQTSDCTSPPPSQTHSSSPSNLSTPYALHPLVPAASSSLPSPSSCPAACSAQPDSQSYPRCWARSHALVAAQLRLRGGGRDGVRTLLVRQESVGIGIGRFVRVLRRRRMRIGISRRPVGTLLAFVVRKGRRDVVTSRMPTQDSAMLTRRLSCAHLRARWASLVARSARFCWRWICTMRATLGGC